MIKRVFAIAIATLILIIACLPVYAADTITSTATPGDFTPVKLRPLDDSNSDNGFWNPQLGGVGGDYVFSRSKLDLYHVPWSIDTYYTGSAFYKVTGWEYLFEYTDSSGTLLTFYITDLVFRQAFCYLNHPSGEWKWYDTIRIVLRVENHDKYGVLNDIQLTITDSSLADTSLNPDINIWHSNDGTLEGTDYYGGARLHFAPRTSEGGSITVNGIINKPEQALVYYWYPHLFGNFNANIGFRYAADRIMNPIQYVDETIPEDVMPPVDVGSDEGTGGGSVGGSDGGGTPVQGFTEMMRLTISAFRDILSISFFNGFFTLGDCVGIVVALGLLTLIIKWFAGK